MNKLLGSQCYLRLAKIPFNFDDNYILEGNSIEYFTSKGGFYFNKVQMTKFENKLKYVLRLDDDFNAQFNQISMSTSYRDNTTYNKLFIYAIFRVDNQYLGIFQNMIPSYDEDKFFCKIIDSWNKDRKIYVFDFDDLINGCLMLNNDEKLRF